LSNVHLVAPPSDDKSILATWSAVENPYMSFGGSRDISISNCVW